MPASRAPETVFDRCLLVGACLEWQGAIRSDGYGSVGFNSIHRKPHHVAFAVSYGFSLDEMRVFTKELGLYVMHTCDNRRCINPSHLILGTASDNAADRSMKGRSSSRRGGCSGRAKLTEESARRILSDQRPTRDIASAYCVSMSTVQRIRNGSQWSHLVREENNGNH
jgi:hypothetical protein